MSFDLSLASRSAPLQGRIADMGMRADLCRPQARAKTATSQSAAACNGTTSFKWVPLVEACLVNSPPS